MGLSERFNSFYKPVDGIDDPYMEWIARMKIYTIPSTGWSLLSQLRVDPPFSDTLRNLGVKAICQTKAGQDG